MNVARKKTKAATPDKIASYFTKDITKGKKEANAALKRKRVPKVVSPEKPILPDRYQLKFL